MTECVEVREDQNLGKFEGSRSCWSGAGAEAMRELVKLLAEEHEVAVGELLFSGNVLAPINCRVCRKAWPSMVARRNHDTKNVAS